MNTKKDIECMKGILSMKTMYNHKIDEQMMKIIDSGWLETKEGKEASKKWGYRHETSKPN